MGRMPKILMMMDGRKLTIKRMYELLMIKGCSWENYLVPVKP